MKKVILSFLFLWAAGNLTATTITSFNFNAGTLPAGWSITPTPATGANSNGWIVNNKYGINPNLTPAQPAGVTGNPASYYLHIYNYDMCAFSVNTCNALYDDSYSTNSTVTTADISTTSYTGVTISFYYLCNGYPAEDFGQVYYSTNSGGSWTQLGSNIQGISTWTLATLPASTGVLDNQATLRFKFVFSSAGNGWGGDQPSFAIDEVVIAGTPPGSITTGTVTPLSYCPCASVLVPYTITGTYTGGNVFTAELSSSTGTWAGPTSIGTLSSTAAGTVSATIPCNATSGTGYRIRVVSSTPAVTGTDNGANITINALPPISTTSNVYSLCSGNSCTFTAVGAGTGGTYSWSPTTGLSSASGASVTATPASPTTYTVTGTNSTTGCSNTDTNYVNVTVSPTVTAIATNYNLCLGSSSTFGANGSGGGSGTYTWLPVTGLTPTSGQAVVATPPSGTTIYTVTYTNTSGCSATDTNKVIVNSASVNVTTTGIGVCLGNSATLTAHGAVVYTWQPTTGLNNPNLAAVISSPVTPTTYTVTGTLAGCSDTGMVFIDVYQNPVVTMNDFVPDSSCANATPFALPSGTPTGGIYSGTGVAGTNFNPGVAGPGTFTIKYTYTDANSCKGVDSSNIKVVVCSGIEDVPFSPDLLTVYPNPSNGPITIIFNNVVAGSVYEVTNSLGATVYREEIKDMRAVLHLAPGIYVIRTSDMNTKPKKLIIY